MYPQVKQSGWSKPWQEWESGVDMDRQLLLTQLSVKGSMFQSSAGVAGDGWWVLLAAVSEDTSGCTCWG